MYISDDSAQTRVQGWRTLTALHCALETALGEALKPYGLSVVEYTVMDALGRQDGWHLRMKQLARVAALSESAATRMVNRLAQRGLICRALCHADRRGIYTELTDKGWELIRAAQPTHDAVLCTLLDESPLVAALDELFASLREGQ